VAVVQISKIQVRRGQKNSNSGVPQLSSAEFAWAVDSQELFIGNGSVAEGAPYVGNTKIITEHDNLLELASSYQFAPAYLTGSVPRSLQGKLDEYVSILDFGAVGDGSTDCTDAFELAFLELFRNTNPNYKKVLTIPNGEYLFLRDLKIPSGTIIRGETPAGVVLNIDTNNVQFVTSNGEELGSFNSINRPTNIHISNITVRRSSGQLVLSGVADSIFEDITFQGEYDLVDAIADINVIPPSMFWQNTDDGTKTTNLLFRNCNFLNDALSVKCIQDDVFSTEIKFDSCTFFINHTSILINGTAGQNNSWKISNCTFEEVYAQAFKSTQGRYTIISDSNFVNCGNGNSPTIPLYPIVYFGEKTGNVLVNCVNDRAQLNHDTVQSNPLYPSETTAITEVYNSDYSTFINRNYAAISYSVSYTSLTVLSAQNKSYTVKYFLQLGTHTRTGKLTISVSSDSTDVAITDEYQYSPSLVLDPGGTTMTNFEFSAVLANNDAVTGNETVVIGYKNPTSGATGLLSYDLAYGV
jgi:hypothetical protein